MTAVARTLGGRYDGQRVVFEVRAPRARYAGIISASHQRRELGYVVFFGHQGAIAMLGGIVACTAAGLSAGLPVGVGMGIFTVIVWVGIPMVLAPLSLRRSLRKVIKRFSENPGAPSQSKPRAGRL